MLHRAAAALLAFSTSLPAQRVLVIGLDGFGYRALTRDEATRDMPALRSVIARGVAAPMRTAFPSTTANSHIALATGAWGDINGKHANSHAVLPRAEHTSFERTNGFRADGLLAEPVWVTAARKGLPAAAVNFVPTYPFLPAIAPSGLPLTVINNYQTRKVLPNRLLTEKDMREQPCAQGLRCFAWEEGGLHFTIALAPSGYADVALAGASQTVRAWPKPLESDPPLNRPLARHFSDGLRLREPVPTVVYFRLFSLSADRRSFTLLRTCAQELGVFDARDAELRGRLLAEAGGVVDNGSELGSPLDDTSLRRTLELDELAIRQQGRLQDWVWRNRKPRLQLGYFSYPDHADHAWLGLSAANPRIAFARRWVYTALDRALKPLIGSISARDSVVFVSDHGMGPVQKHVRPYLPLEHAGLVARTANGELDTRRSKVSLLYNCLLVNTVDWKGGIVPAAERDSIVKLAARALAELRDPETHQPVFGGFYSTPERKAALGFGGPAGADLCMDPAPGYYLNASFNGPVVETLKRPTGQHGGSPLREDMRSIFVAAGPRLRFPNGLARMRAIDVAPLVSALLGIAPPAQAAGHSPLQSQ